MGSLASALCLCLFVVLNGVVAQTPFPSSGTFSVYAEKGGWNVVPGKVDNYVAVAQIQNNPNITGWATLDVETNSAQEDVYQAFAAGYIEGALTTELIWQSWITQLEYFYDGAYSKAAAAWIAKNDAWVRSNVKTCEGLKRGTAPYAAQDCDYWYQINLVNTQLEGMSQGYNDHAGADKQLSYEIFLWINTNADLGDILSAIDPGNTYEGPLQWLQKDHCSVLVRANSGNQELFHSHTTWGHYVNMLRIFKHYTFRFNHPSTASYTVSFSSVPAWIPSGDDYFVTDKGLIVTETTNDVFNMSLYENVVPTTVLYWLRVVVANRMASNGSEWVKIFAKYNSGTYNNQWQVTDTKLFTPGQSTFQPNTLWILEQIPGYTESADVTFFLNNQGFFPSYNIPYFPFIYNISGYPAQYKQYGDGYSYSACPRANIFRRDAGKVETLEQFQDIMRYNEYQTDPFSLGDPCNAISARCDLNTTEVMPFGGSDCKVTSTVLMKTLTTNALSGPTTLTQAPFSWTGPFEDVPHYGQPTLFNFSFEVMQPQNLV